MSNRKVSRIVGLLVVLALIAPLSAWAGSGGHHRSHGHRSHGVHVGHGGHYGYRGHHGYYGHRYHGYRGYGGHYGHGGYYRYRSSHFYGPDDSVYRAAGSSETLGALDLNVKPKSTQVYLNGDYIGVTGKFDGSPDHLWLEEGTYELIFHNKGYMTVIREFEIHAGAVIDVKLRLVPGQSVPPEELISKGPVGDESS